MTVIKRCFNGADRTVLTAMVKTTISTTSDTPPSNNRLMSYRPPFHLHQPLLDGSPAEPHDPFHLYHRNHPTLYPIFHCSDANLTEFSDFLRGEEWGGSDGCCCACDCLYLVSHCIKKIPAFCFNSATPSTSPVRPVLSKKGLFHKNRPALLMSYYQYYDIIYLVQKVLFWPRIASIFTP